MVRSFTYPGLWRTHRNTILTCLVLQLVLTLMQRLEDTCTVKNSIAYGSRFGCFKTERRGSSYVWTQISQNCIANVSVHDDKNVVVEGVEGAAKQSDRVASGAVSNTQQLTTYSTSTEVVIGTKATVPMLGAFNPYPPSGMDNVLTRSYQLGTTDWIGGDIVGAIVKNYKFPQDLVSASTFLQEKMRDFKFFKAGVNLELVVNTTEFDYGALLVSWLPYYQPTIDERGYWRMANLYSCAQCKPLILSAQKGSTVKMLIPWQNPHQYMNTDSTKFEIGQVVIRVLHPLRSATTTTPSNVSITAFANFDKPELAGFSPGTIPDMPFKKSKARKGNETQASKQEAEAKSKVGMISGVFEAASTLAPAVGTMVPALAPLTDVAMALSSALSPIFKSVGLDKPHDLQALTPTFSSNRNWFVAGKGLDPATCLSIDPMPQIAVQKGICGPEDPQPKLRDIIAIPGMVYRSSYTNTSTADKHITDIPIDPAFMPIVDSTGGVGVAQPTPLGYYSQFFAGWRGTLKYMIYFHTSKFITNRVRITHLLEDTAADLTDYTGDIVSKVVDVCGDTTVAFSIGYCSKEYYLPNRAPILDNGIAGGLGFIRIDRVNDIQSPDVIADPPIYYTVWVAAGDDWRFFRYTGLQFSNYGITDIDTFGSIVPATQARTKRNFQILKSKPKKGNETQSNPVEDFKVPFAGLVPTKYNVEACLVNGEDYGCITDLMHRYSTWQTVVEDVTSLVYSDLYQESSTFQPYLLGAPFMFYRGSRRFAILSRLTDTVINAVFTLPQNPGAIGTVEQTDYNAPGSYNVNTTHESWEVPWTSTEAFKETVPTIGNWPSMSNKFLSSSSFYLSLLSSVGDDFSLGTFGAVPGFIYAVEPAPSKALSTSKSTKL